MCVRVLECVCVCVCASQRREARERRRRDRAAAAAMSQLQARHFKEQEDVRAAGNPNMAQPAGVCALSCVYGGCQCVCVCMCCNFMSGYSISV